MKSLIVMVASLLFSTQMNTKNSNRPEFTDSFLDVVKSLSDENKTLVVKFHNHNSIYYIAHNHPQYNEIKVKLENAKKVDQKVKVIAILPSMTIKDISRS